MLPVVFLRKWLQNQFTVVRPVIATEHPDVATRATLLFLSLVRYPAVYLPSLRRHTV